MTCIVIIYAISQHNKVEYYHNGMTLKTEPTKKDKE